MAMVRAKKLRGQPALSCKAQLGLTAVQIEPPPT